MFDLEIPISNYSETGNTVFSFFIFLSFTSFRNSECFLFVSEVFLFISEDGVRKVLFSITAPPPLVLMINGRLIIFSTK